MNRSNQASSNSGSRFPAEWMNIISRELGEVAREFADGISQGTSIGPGQNNVPLPYPVAPGPFTTSTPPRPATGPAPGQAPEPFTTSTGPLPTQSTSPVPQPTLLTTPTRVQYAVDLDEMIFRYNQNIREYNQNMRDMVQLVSQLTMSNRFVEPPPQTPVQEPLQNDNSIDYTTIFSYLLYPAIPPTNTTANLRNHNISPPTLTRDQIMAATRTYGYVGPDNSANTVVEASIDVSLNVVVPESLPRCPITLEVFQPGDVLCEIRGCRHVFKRPGLMNWFRRNSHCPVCRYNLFDYPANELNNVSP